MLNNIIEKLNDSYEVDCINDEIINNLEVNELGFMAIKSTEMLTNYGFSMIAFTPVKKDNEIRPLIIVDFDFEDLTKEAQEFLIYHELGHFYKQYDKTVAALNNGVALDRDLNDEFEADEYSMSIVGKENAIKGLCDAIELIEETSFGTNEKGIEEIKIRIENLRK